MRYILGSKGLTKSWQKDFKEIVKCVHCGKKARIAFVAFEGMGNDPAKKQKKSPRFVCDLHQNELSDSGPFWVHDCIAVATYFCTKCGEATSVYNQA